MLPPLLLSLLISFLCFGESLIPRTDLVIGRKVPNVELIDSDGNKVFLRDVASGKVLLMTFIYSSCTSSCPLIVENLKKALPREDFVVALIDFDERNTPESLRKFVKVRNIEEPFWKPLLAKGESLRLLSGVLDFKYFYDEKTDTFFHPNVLIILTPDLRVSSYILGLTYDPSTLERLIKKAKKGEINQNPIKGIILQCFRYDPITGTYTVDWSFVAMLIGGGIPLAVMFYFIFLRDFLLKLKR